MQLLIQEFAAIEKYAPFAVLVLVEDYGSPEVDKEEIFLYLLHVLQNPQSVFLWEILLWMKYKIGIKKDIGRCYFSARYITHIKSKRQERHISPCNYMYCLYVVFVVWPLPIEMSSAVVGHQEMILGIMFGGTGGF